MLTTVPPTISTLMIAVFPVAKITSDVTICKIMTIQPMYHILMYSSTRTSTGPDAPSALNSGLIDIIPAVMRSNEIRPDSKMA